MIGDTVVTITWMDGKTETITCYSVSLNNGSVLHLTMRIHSNKPNRHIPLANIREYTTDAQ